MKLGQDPVLDDLRVQVRALVARHNPPSPSHTGARAPLDSDVPALRRWIAALYSEGLCGTSWPVEYGGLESVHPQHEAVVAEELIKLHAPTHLGAGLLAGAAIIAAGTQQQKDHFLPRIRSSEHLWCQLFSEPGAGSDLASLTTKARQEGDNFVINGQKVWTTVGQFADWGYLLARTSSEGAKQQGITAFAIDMRTPGVDVRPLREITGTCDFNEVFLRDVVVPAENVIGEVGGGWMVAMASLVKERSAAGGGIGLFSALDDLVEMARSVSVGGRLAISRDDVRQQLGKFVADTQVTSLLSAYRESRDLAGHGDAADAPLSKIFFSEVNLALAEYGMRLQGADGTRVEGDGRAFNDGWWQDAFLYARAFTIAGGANEVLRNMVAERGLGMPRK